MNAKNRHNTAFGNLPVQTPIQTTQASVERKTGAFYGALSRLPSPKKALAFLGEFCNNVNLSQNLCSSSPNCSNWLFLRQDTATGAGVNPSSKDFAQTKHLSSYDGATPQNKPIGEYVGRLLHRPRVSPITLLAVISQTQNYVGVFTMNAFLERISHYSPIQSFAIGFIATAFICALVLLGGAA
ncbi:hypothetical protein B0181_03380 [Moraxella caviae]|nr:hypothetical protein B0181_03380 [Moraxella caviae]